MDRGTLQATVHGSQRVEHKRATNTYTLFIYYVYMCVCMYICADAAAA